MKRLLVACLLAVLAAPAFAVIGTADDVPAATLLLPYFEVDLDNPEGVTTLMSINNASANPVVAHVVVWTDLSRHVLDFDVYLTGYDVQTINLRDIFVVSDCGLGGDLGGCLPVTADAGTDPAGAALGIGISPRGPASEDWVYPVLPGAGANDCSDILPYDNPALSQNLLELFLQPMLTGEASAFPNLFFGLCGSISHDADRIARGYITVDAVDNCNIEFPDSEGYFVDGGAGRAINDNVLWGDYFYVNPGENFAQGETLVHIEADSALTDLDYTFYYRYTTDPLFPGLGGFDDREGLGNVFAARYVNGGPFDGGTSYLVWRDSKYGETDFFSCADVYPDPFPLGVTQVVMFDEEENFEVPDTGGCTISPCPGPGPDPDSPFPWETQRVKVGTGSLVSSYNFGWTYLNLNIGVVDSDVTVDNGYLMQNWVSLVMDAQGRFSVGFDAIQLGNVTYTASAPNDCIEVGGPVPCIAE